MIEIIKAIGVIGSAAIVLAIVVGILISFYFAKKEEFYEHMARKTERKKSAGGREQGQSGSGSEEHIRS